MIKYDANGQKCGFVLFSREYYHQFNFLQPQQSSSLNKQQSSVPGRENPHYPQHKLMASKDENSKSF